MSLSTVVSLGSKVWDCIILCRFYFIVSSYYVRSIFFYQAHAVFLCCWSLCKPCVKNLCPLIGPEPSPFTTALSSYVKILPPRTRGQPEMCRYRDRWTGCDVRGDHPRSPSRGLGLLQWRATCPLRCGLLVTGSRGLLASSTRWVLPETSRHPSSGAAEPTRPVSSRDQRDAPLTCRRDFLSDSEMNLKWTVKRLLLVSLSVSHLLSLEGESHSFNTMWGLCIKLSAEIWIWTMLKNTWDINRMDSVCYKLNLPMNHYVIV